MTIVALGALVGLAVQLHAQAASARTSPTIGWWIGRSYGLIGESAFISRTFGWVSHRRVVVGAALSNHAYLVDTAYGFRERTLLAGVVRQKHFGALILAAGVSSTSGWTVHSVPDCDPLFPVCGKSDSTFFKRGRAGPIVVANALIPGRPVGFDLALIAGAGGRPFMGVTAGIAFGAYP